MKLTLGRSTRYDAKVVTVPHGIACRPRWTIEVQCDDWKRHSAISREMNDWLNDNLTGTRVHYRSAMSSAIEAITFRKHADAMLFYLRWV